MSGAAQENESPAAEKPTKMEGRLARSHSIINPRMYKREPSKRVFVNRSLMLEKVRFFGFDMDYTLAEGCVVSLCYSVSQKVVCCVVSLCYSVSLKVVCCVVSLCYSVSQKKVLCCVVSLCYSVSLKVLCCVVSLCYSVSLKVFCCVVSLCYSVSQKVLCCVVSLCYSVSLKVLCCVVSLCYSVSLKVLCCVVSLCYSVSQKVVCCVVSLCYSVSQKVVCCVVSLCYSVSQKVCVVSLCYSVSQKVCVVYLCYFVSQKVLCCVVSLCYSVSLKVLCCVVSLCYSVSQKVLCCVVLSLVLLCVPEVYKSPEYEQLGFNLLKRQLVDMGYPQAISDFEYDPTFPIRGLWFDNLYGNLLKVDAFGNILVCITGFHFLRGTEIHKLYPNKFVQMDENRFHIFNTLYELPVLYILACLVDYFCNCSDFTRTKTGVKCGDLTMTFTSIYQDVLSATGFVHAKQGPLKRETVKNVEKYVQRDERLPLLLDRLRSNGAKVFLATNSDYTYSNAGGEKRDWLSFFDYVVVDAKKPLFFLQGTILRQVDKESGALKIGTHTGPISSKHVYSGGSVDVFSEIMGTYGHEVLYVGDHIFGDILKSKKARGWRTFLCVPELAQELTVWTEKKELFAHLEDFDVYISDLYKNLDSSSKEKPDISKIQRAIRDVTHEMDMAYGMLGSLFRTGSCQTFFASQVMRYADLYAASFMNLINYPLNYIFRAPAMLMPHESTVNHEDVVSKEMRRLTLCNRSRTISETPDHEEKARQHPPLTRDESVSNVPHPFAETPQQVTHCYDCLLEEEQEDGAPSEPAE
ncbi:hypothetical protein ACOMHN_008673 [Nucella lapillus]